MYVHQRRAQEAQRAGADAPQCTEMITDVLVRQHNVRAISASGCEHLCCAPRYYVEITNITTFFDDNCTGTHNIDPTLRSGGDSRGDEGVKNPNPPLKKHPVFFNANAAKPLRCSNGR